MDVPRPAGRLHLWIGAALMLAACDVSGMAFTQDNRVEILAPEDRAVVTLPVTVEWNVRDFEVTGRDGTSRPDAGYFAVFVDRPPIPPARSLEWYVKQDDSCGRSACGDIANLAHVYTTNDTHLTLTQLPATGPRSRPERHEVVVVLMDGTGQRIGESAFYVRFTHDRGA